MFDISQFNKLYNQIKKLEGEYIRCKNIKNNDGSIPLLLDEWDGGEDEIDTHRGLFRYWGKAEGLIDKMFDLLN